MAQMQITSNKEDHFWLVCHKVCQRDSGVAGQPHVSHQADGLREAVSSHRLACPEEELC